MAVACSHPDPADLEAFALGTLADAATVESHVAQCPSCQERVADVAVDSLVELLREAHARAAAPADNVSLTPAEALERHERYRVVRLVGEGGMGSVYEAEHRVMRRRVALKVIRRPMPARPATLDRFRREARAAAQLSHPNIVTTFDAEDDGDCLFLAMEYVEGVTLGRHVRERGPLPVTEACGYVRQAALGLQHAHERGLIHRDVKPDNLMRTPDGAVKVLDFGLAALTAERGDCLTDMNVVMGTPEYLAPEQAEDAQRADARSDVYSLGCTLHHLLTGRVPYPAPTALLKVLAHREQPLPPMPDAPSGLGRVLAKMMAKRPEDRYQTSGEAAAALEPFTRPPRPPRRPSWLLVAAVGAVLLAAAATVHRIETDRGTLVITVESDDVEMVVRQHGRMVRLLDTKTEKSITLYSGEYELELKGAEGLKLDIDRVTLKRGKTVLATVERVKKPFPPVREEPRTPEIGVVTRLHWGVHAVYNADLSPDGKLIVAGGGFGETRVWEIPSGKVRYSLRGGQVAFINEGKQILTQCGLDSPSQFLVYDARTGQLLREFGANRPQGSSLISGPGGRTVVGVTYDGTARLWDVATETELTRWAAPDHWNSFLFTAEGEHLLFKSGGKGWRTWDIVAGKETAAFAKLGGRGGVFLAGGREVLENAGDHFKVLDVATGKEVRRVRWPGKWDAKVDAWLGHRFLTGGRRVIASYPDKTVRVSDLDGDAFREVARVTFDPPVWTIGLCFSADGRTAAAFSRDGYLIVLRLPAPPAKP